MIEKSKEIKSKMKITIKITDESDATATNIMERLEDLSEKLEEIKEKFDELEDKVPENISTDVYEKWDDVLDNIEEYIDEI